MVRTSNAPLVPDGPGPRAAGPPAPQWPLPGQPALSRASSRGAAIAGPLRAAVSTAGALPCQRRPLISRGGDPPPRPWARARARAYTHTHTNSLLEAPSGPDPLPHAPFHRPQRTPGERPLQLEKVLGEARGGQREGESKCVCARVGGARPGGGASRGMGREEID